MSTSAALPRAFVAMVAVLACWPSTAGAAISQPPLGGALTITGTAGKDDFRVAFFAATGVGATVLIEPAVPITATSGSCSPDTDPATGRPIRTECRVSLSSATSLFVDLRAGDDRVTVDDGDGILPNARVSGGAGNDSIELETRSNRTLQGDDGNDVLSAPGKMSENPGTNRAAVYEGGAGTDTTAFDDSVVSRVSGNVPIGVVASLATNTAVFSGLNQANQQTTFRTDTLSSIEGLVGTEVGDVLTGGTAADTLAGGEGNDNLNGGGGNDNLQGGDDLDDLVGAAGNDSLDGGIGIDTYPKGGGGDSFLTRDGYVEDVPCTKEDTIIDDLVDRVVGETTGCSISTAAAKHRYDTKLSGRPAKIEGGALETRVRCPARKSTTCKGEVEALLGRQALAHAAYKVRPGNKADVRLPISQANARKAGGRKILLSASEIDADGRDRFISRPTRVAKQRR